MSELKITKYNESYIKCTSEDLGLLQSLSDFFTFQVPGASFMPSVRARRWDGKIRMFSKATGKIYYGLLPYINEFCRRNAHTIIHEAALTATRNHPTNTFSKYIDGLSIPDLKIRQYQTEAVQHAINNKRAVLVSPTASGKSLIIYCIIRMLRESDGRVLLIVPTTSLVEQMYKDFISYGYDAEANVQRKYYGYEIDTDKKIVVSTWQSLATFDKDYFKQFDCVIGDEAHLYKSKELQKIMAACINAKYRIGTTGTLDDSKVHKLVLEGLFGPVHYVTTTRELIDKNQLANLKIECLVLKYPKEECMQIKNAKFQDEMDYIVTHERRNKFLTNLALDQKGNTLVLFQYVEKHGKPLHEQIKAKSKNRKVFFVYGGTETDDRERIRAITEKLDNTIIVASYGTFSTGINIRNLHNIIFASPTKSPIRVLQSIGRGLRLGEQKDTAKVYDISDDFTYKEKKNFTIQHFLERINIYNEQQFDYDIHTVDLV
jgi:superfamily II DNA or RNA helicase